MENRIAGISDPDTDKDSWSGSTVYFGDYDTNNTGVQERVKYRVLDAVTTDYSSDGSTETMLLDCDNILLNKAFDDDNPVKEWSNSDINKWLNDSTGDGFLANAFTDLEQQAVIESENASHGNWDAIRSDIGYTGLNGEKVFLMDAREAGHKEYGYGCLDSKVINGKAGEYWLRSSNALMVDADGNITEGSGEKGVSPALNVRLKDILFTSSASTDPTESFQKTVPKDSYEPWKLTLCTGEKIEVEVIADNWPYLNKGTVCPGVEDRNKMSLRIKTDVSMYEYDGYTAMLVDKNGTVEAYGRIYNGKIGSTTSRKYIDIEFPDNISEGEYSIKIFAEKTDDSLSTNYASEMESLHVRVGKRTADEINYGPSVLCNTDLPDWEDDGYTEWNYVDGMRVSFGSCEYSFYDTKYIYPMLWHVLKSDGATEAFLDGEEMLGCGSPSYSDYEDVNDWLNNDFLEWFNPIEREWIQEKELEADEFKIKIQDKSEEVVFKNESLKCKVFCLSAREAYEYYKNPYNSSDVYTRNKFTPSAHIGDSYPDNFSLIYNITNYLLRSYYEDDDGIHMGSVNSGELGEGFGYSEVIPSLYLNLSDVLFVSDSNFDKTLDYKGYKEVDTGLTEGNVYKFTLRDNDMSLSKNTDNGMKVTKTKEGNKWTLHIPLKYEDKSPEAEDDITGTEEFQISLMINDTAGDETSAASSQTHKIKYYAKAVSEIPENGIIDIELPEDFTGDSIYLAAEKVHPINYENAYDTNMWLTDYASNILEIKVPQIINEVKVQDFDTPQALKALDMEGLCDTEGVTEGLPEGKYEKYVDGVISPISTEEEEKADFGTSYRVTVTLSPKEDYYFSDELKKENVTVNGNIADNIIINKDGTLTIYYTFEPTLNPKLISVEQPQDIIVLNGTPKTKEDLGLPDYADINIESGKPCQREVTWDLENLADGTTYDPELLTEQRFTVNGTFTLPDNIINPDNVPTAIKVNVIAQAADVTGIPYADPPSGKYNESLNVKLYSNTEGAQIYYTLDGSVPDKESGIKYTQAIPITGKPGEAVKAVIKAIAYKDKMQCSEVAEFEYEVSVPLPTYKLTVINGLGSGEYEAGTVCSITANDAPAGKRFKEWAVIKGNVNLQDPAVMTAEFTMPEQAVEVEAVYEDIPPKEYEVTVTDDGNGKANADVAQATAGSKIKLSYNAGSGYHFKEWQIIEGNIAIQDNGFIMPEGNVTVKAIFEKDEEPSSEEPSSEEPSSEEPSSEEPSSEEPSSEEPSSEEPSSEEPSSEEPSSEEPSSEEPSSEEPSSEEPSSEKPTTKETTTKETTTKETTTKETTTKETTTKEITTKETTTKQPTTKEPATKSQETTLEMQSSNKDNDKTESAATDSSENREDNSHPASTGDDVPVTWLFILIISGAGSLLFGRNKASFRKKQ